MRAPHASRPYMPGYGLLSPGEGSGLLPWSWAEKRIRESHDYWIATRWPDGRPHVMPVWGLWHDGALWFSSSRRSRKARNLIEDPRCVVTTEDPRAPVVMEGTAERVTDTSVLMVVLDLENRKYSTSYGNEVLDPKANAWFRIHPRWAFGIAAGDFTGSPTRWRFSP